MIRKAFLSANTARGFVSLYGEFLQNKRSYIIKGGPGTGKSTVIKNIGAYGESIGEDAEYIYCSSDTASLDGVYIPGRNAAVCDGTAPHVLETENPGCDGGIISLTDTWNEKALAARKSDITGLKREIALCYKKAYFLLNGIAALCDEARAEVCTEYNMSRVGAVSERLAAKYIKKSKNGVRAEEKRFLSSFTPVGVTTFFDTAEAEAKRIFLLPHAHGLGNLALAELLKETVKKKVSARVYYDILSPDLPAWIFLPDSGIAFATFSPLLGHFVSDKIKEIPITDRGEIKEEAAKYGIKKQLMRMSTEELRRAKQLHGELEKIYIENTDFAKTGNITAALMTRVFAQ